ncbi:MAG: hypothetical protein K0V04_35145, partial [Deltaproteobacteria bacterium]|nr:hypothetical protein [Deltaproteobacteria bacterium]
NAYDMCEPSACTPSTLVPDCGGAEAVDEHGLACVNGRCLVPDGVGGPAKLLMGPRRPIRRIHTLEARSHAFAMSLMPSEEAQPCCALEGDAQGGITTRAKVGT